MSQVYFANPSQMEGDLAKTLGQRITELRGTTLSKQALADKLEVSRNAVMAWEDGRAVPDTVNLVALADLFGVSLDALTGRTELPATEGWVQSARLSSEGIAAAGEAIRQLLSMLEARKLLSPDEKERVQRILGDGR